MHLLFVVFHVIYYVKSEETCFEKLREGFTTIPEESLPINKHKLLISEGNDGFSPGETYTIRLVASSTSNMLTYDGFFLTVNASRSTGYITRSNSAGVLHLLESSLTKFSEKCPNTVTHTSNLIKSEISVLWTAPMTKLACVTFYAFVLKFHSTWHLESDMLSLTICPRRNDQKPTYLSPHTSCCACKEAKYNMAFESLWSQNTHPKNFPVQHWDVGFSDFIGASHSSEYHIWKLNKYASEGLQQLAKWGDSTKLEKEIRKDTHKVRTLIKARAISLKNPTHIMNTIFRVSPKHHYVSFLTSIKPSPDWVIGISDLELCAKNCSWKNSISLYLYPIDIGTEDGATYTSVAGPSIPPQKIHYINSRLTVNSPFFRSKSETAFPMARLSINLLRLYDFPCSNDRVDKNTINSQDENCRTTSWSGWSSCSVSCGSGSRSRIRDYIEGPTDQYGHCTNQLVQYKPCIVAKPCREKNITLIRNWRSSSKNNCLVTKWSKWSFCKKCVKFQLRRRSYKVKHLSGKCNIPLQEIKNCSHTKQFLKYCKRTLKSKNNKYLDTFDLINPLFLSTENTVSNFHKRSICVVKDWSSWSECSAKCGVGIKLRTRQFKNQSETISPECQDVSLSEYQSCNNQQC